MCKKLSCLAVVLIVAAGVVLLGTAIGLGVYFGTSKDKGQPDENTSTQPVVTTRPDVLTATGRVLRPTRPEDKDDDAVTATGAVLRPTRPEDKDDDVLTATGAVLRPTRPEDKDDDVLTATGAVLRPTREPSMTKVERDFIRQVMDGLTIARAAAKPVFELGPFPASGEGNALRMRVKITDCKDVDEDQEDVGDVRGKKYWKLRVLYAFDESLSLSGDAKVKEPGHVAKHCRSYGDTKTVAIGLWLVDKDGKEDSASRRKFFNRFPMDDFMKVWTPVIKKQASPLERPQPFRHQIIERLETEELGLRKEHLPTLLWAMESMPMERVLIGHGNAGPGALALFTSYPRDFKTAVLVDPAFYDAATRVMLQTAEKRDTEEFALALDRSQAATDDKKSTSELFAAIRAQASAKPKAKAAYRKYWDYLKRNANATGDDVLTNGDDILKLAKDGNKLPRKLQNEYKRTLTALQDAFAKNNKRNLAHFLDDDTGKAGRWDKTAKQKSKKWAPLRILDATKNRLYRTSMLRKLGNAQVELQLSLPKRARVANRKLIMSVGDGLPRPWGSEKDPGSKMGGTAWETDNPFDMIPWQVYLWEHALLEAKMPRLEVKDVLVMSGGHQETLALTIEQVLKVEGGNTILDN